MTDYNLEGFKRSATYQLGQVAGHFVIPKDSLEFYMQARTICDHFITLASASLLANYKIEFFYLNLARCAANWKNFLHCHYQLNNRHAPMRYTAPFYAAVITGDDRLIQDLLNAITREVLEGEEYAKNIYKTRLFLQIIKTGERDIKLEKRWHEKFVQADGDDISAALFALLIDLDDEAEGEFWETFEAAFYAYEQSLLSKIKSVNTKISEFIGHRYIWFEGVCWLKLAKKRGFTLPSSAIHYCPDEALMVMPSAYENDWQIIKHDVALHQVE